MASVLTLTHLYPDPNFDCSVRNGAFIHRSMMSLLSHGHTVNALFFMPWLPTLFFGDTQNELPTSYSLDGVNVLPVKYVPKLSRSCTVLDVWLKAKSAWKKLPREYKPDVIYAQQLFPDLLVAEKLSRWLDVPFVAIMRGSDVHTILAKNTGLQRLVTDKLSSAKSLLSVSDALATQAREIFDRPDLGIETLYTICDTDRCINRMPFAESPKRIVVVGALVESKGVFDAVTAFTKIHRRHPEFQLTFVGQGSQRGRLEEIVRERGLEEVVRFRGFLNGDSLIDEINLHDILLMPSHCEGLPNAVIEGVSCERIVIASNVGGVSEIANESSSFVLVRARQPDDIVAAVQQICESPIQKLRESAKVARQEVIQRFNQKAHADHLSKILTDAI